MKIFFSMNRILLTSSISGLIFFGACTKVINNTPEQNAVIPDFVSKVNSSVSGFVIDENNVPAVGANVSVGNMTAVTDEYGYFEIRNVEVVKIAATVTATKPGYFKAVKTYIAQNNKAAFFRIKLLSKINAGNISSISGGNVSLSNGLNISLPANAVINATSNASYDRMVNVATKWIDPTSAEVNLIMPGDLRGLDEAGVLKTLTTYGMVAVELTGAAGELLQIADGKKATLTMPIPSSILGSAPASIPLWYFDETKGVWKMEGNAVKTGSSYIGEVSHFSFWNCDIPNSYVQFECTVVDADGSPIPFALVRITEVGNSPNSNSGWTDASGYVNGAIPDNAVLLLEVFSDYSCGSPVYTQTITTTNSNISLETISVNNSAAVASVTGSVTNCNNGPVTNGYVILQVGQYHYRYPVSNTGAFDFTFLYCNTSSAAALTATDASTLQQSAPLNFNLVSGQNSPGNIQACGISVQEFLNFTLDGRQYSFSAPYDTVRVDTVSWTVPNSIQIFAASTPGWSKQVEFYFGYAGISVGSHPPFTGIWRLDGLYPSVYTNYNVPTNVLITITEYGAIGEYIAGNFSGTFTGTENPTNILHTLSGNFRIVRIL